MPKRRSVVPGYTKRLQRAMRKVKIPPPPKPLPPPPMADVPVVADPTRS